MELKQLLRQSLILSIVAIFESQLCLASPLAAGTASIEIDARKIVHPVPRTIFGGFLEPIRSAIYSGGIWAQLLENPSFEGDLWGVSAVSHMFRAMPELGQASKVGLPIPWESLREQGSRFEPTWNDAVNSSRSLLIMGLPQTETGIRQTIYPPVRRQLKYTGSLYAKPISGERRLEISLRRHKKPDEVLVKAVVDLSSSNWKRYEFSLALTNGQVASREPVDFAVSVNGESRILIDEATLFPADHIRGLDPEAIALTKSVHMPMLRFGGNFTSGYHWRDGVGPQEKRPSTLNIAWEQPEYNHFGTDEFLDFCRLTGTQPQFCLNLGSGTVLEATEWVKYVNSKWENHSGGLLWELGNELWGKWQIGYPSLTQLAEQTRRFSRAVQDADQKVKLIATGQDPDRFEKWNEQQLSLGSSYFQYLSTHLVVDTSSVIRQNADPDFIAQSMFAVPVGVERKLGEMRAQVDRDPKLKGKVGFALTEWLFRAPFAPAPPDLPVMKIPEYRNLGGAICAGGILNMLIRQADIVPIANMTGLVEFGRLWEKRGIIYGVPSFWLFKMYSNAEVSNYVDTKVEVASYDIKDGSRRAPNVDGVPFLDVVGTTNSGGNKLTIFVINRSLTDDLSASIKLPGFNMRSATGTILASDSIYTGNDDAQPQAVSPKPFSLAASGSNLTHVFPKSSVSMLELSSR